jgi:hypothetical protein
MSLFRNVFLVITVISAAESGCTSSQVVSDFKPQKVAQTMPVDCRMLFEFSDYLDKNRRAKISEIALRARQLLAGASFDNRMDSFLLIDFKSSLPCYRKVISSWEQPISVEPPPSPPPVGPQQGPIEFFNLEDDPFHWDSATFRRFERTVVIGNDGEKIRYLRIDHADAK